MSSRPYNKIVPLSFLNNELFVIDPPAPEYHVALDNMDWVPCTIKKGLFR